MGTTLRFTIEKVREVIEKMGDKLITTEYQNYRQKLVLICHKCDSEYEQSFQMIQKGYLCTKTCKSHNYKNTKSKKGYTHQTITDIQRTVHQGGDKLLSTEYKPKGKLDILCGKCDKTFQMTIDNYKIGQRCIHCYKQSRTLDKTSFQSRVDERGDCLLTDFTNSRATVSIQCGICENIFDILANAYSRGSGCPPCGIDRTRLNYEDVKNRIESFGDTLLSKTYVNNSTPLEIQCGMCGEIYEKILGTPHCKCCNATGLEKYVFMYLKRHQVKFETQKRFADLKTPLGQHYRYDFFLPELNTIIESDGGQHFKCVEFFGGEDHFKKIQERDITKTNYCRNNGIKMIRISFKELVSHEKVETVLNGLFKRLETEQVVFSNDELYEYLM